MGRLQPLKRTRRAPSVRFRSQRGTILTDDNLPTPPSEGDLPTLGELISNWLGFQLPSLPMPQTIKNLDKAVGNILIAGSENAVARIKTNTGKQKAKGKIEIDGMYRTEEERRKLENRAAAVK